METAGFFRNKKVLVTGASGFIGSNLVHRLVGEQASTAVLVRRSSDLWRLEEILPELDLCYADLEDASAVHNALNDVRPEMVFHCGAYGVDSRQQDYATAVRVNVIGAINLFNAAAEAGCYKIVNTGTCMEYGDKKELITEDCEARPLEIYGITKLWATMIAHRIAAEKSIKLITLRPFGVFGGREGSHKFFPHLILSILDGREVRLTSCEQYRDYCFIDNIIDGFLLAARDQTLDNEIFNIAGGKAYKLKYYVNLVYKIMKAEGEPQYGAVPYRNNEMWKQQPDVAKIRNTLHWEAKISLEEGLERTIAWYRENRGKYPTGR
ncbi:MAG: NAD-dependent epimerase/dehydratase family protein [Bacillota bacterium]